MSEENVVEMTPEFEQEIGTMVNAVNNIAANNAEGSPVGGKVTSILGAARSPEAAQVLKMAIDQELAKQKAEMGYEEPKSALENFQDKIAIVTEKQKELFDGNNTIENMEFTPEDEKIMEEMMEDKTGDPEDDALMEQAKKEAAEHAGEPGYMATATVETDPATEKPKIVTIDDENSGMEPITETFEEYLERHANDESLADLPIDENTAAQVIQSQHTDISFEDAQKLASVLKRWKDKEISTIQAYNEFPTFITANFNAQLFSANVPLKDQAKHKKEFAKSILEDLTASTQLQKATDDVNAQIEQVYKEYGDDINVLYQAGIFEKINAMNKAAEAMANEQYTDEENRDLSTDEWEAKKAEKVQTMRDISAALEESFKFEKFAKRIGHIKAKKIDLTDPKRCFSHFNSKYAHSKFSGADVSTIVPILEKHCGFAHEQAVEFAIVFCEYCRNMRPSNIPEHVFMYYTVANINSLAMTVGDKAAQFANGLVGNIKALMAIHEAKGNGEDYVALGLTEEEIDELLKQSTELVKQAEEEAKNEQEAQEAEERSEAASETSSESGNNDAESNEAL